MRNVYEYILIHSFVDNNVLFSRKMNKNRATTITKVQKVMI